MEFELPVEAMDPAFQQECADAANAELASVTDDKKVLGTPRFAFYWGFMRGVKFMQERAKMPAQASEKK